MKRRMSERPTDRIVKESMGFRDSGFTLVEVLIVVVILGILSGIVVIAVGSSTTNSAQAACKSDAKSVEVALEGYKAQNGSYPAPGAGTPSTSPTTYYSPLTSSTNGGPYMRSAP